MPKYLIEGRYNSEGVKGIVREGGSGRREAVMKLAEALGGKLESFYFAIGDVDVYIIVDLPSETAALTASMTANATGLLAARFVPLVAPETVDAAAKQVPAFRGAGQ